MYIIYQKALKCLNRLSQSSGLKSYLPYFNLRFVVALNHLWGEVFQAESCLQCCSYCIQVWTQSRCLQWTKKPTKWLSHAHENSNKTYIWNTKAKPKIKVLTKLYKIMYLKCYWILEFKERCQCNQQHLIITDHWYMHTGHHLVENILLYKQVYWKRVPMRAIKLVVL